MKHAYIPRTTTYNLNPGEELNDLRMSDEVRPLYEHVKQGHIDPSFVVTHRLGLGDAPNGYETFKHKEDECVKVVLKP